MGLMLMIFLFLITIASGVAQTVPALYVFGDSTVDQGNAYGDFGPAFRNSYANFIAICLGLPAPPPYKKMIEKERLVTKTGVNYGYAAVGILNETYTGIDNNKDYWSFDKQIEYFNYTVEHYLLQIIGSKELVLDYLSKSIFLISFGINDFKFNLLEPSNATQSHSTPECFADYLLEQLTTRLTTLYGLGARKFVVKSIWPLGCTPQFENVSDPLAELCNQTINDMLIPYRDCLGPKLENLQGILPDSTFSHTNDFEFVWDIKANGKKYGITNTKDPCNWCPNPDHCNWCPNPDQYLYIDYLHTTEAANKIYALHCFNGTLCSPRNIVQLVGA